MDCSLNYQFSTWKLQVQNMARTWQEHVLPMFCPCSALVVFMFSIGNSMNNQSAVILWVNWCKNMSFWQRLTCTYQVIILEMIYWLCYSSWCFTLVSHELTINLNQFNDLQILSIPSRLWIPPIGNWRAKIASPCRPVWIWR